MYHGRFAEKAAVLPQKQCPETEVPGQLCQLKESWNVPEFNKLGYRYTLT